MAINLTTQNFVKHVLNNNQLVLVEFYAEWSGSTQIINPMLTTLEEIYRKHVLFCRLNVEYNDDIAQQYGVTDIPTILIFNKGKVIDYLAGIFPRTAIEKKLNELIGHQQ